jgi:hypothetical protein
MAAASNQNITIYIRPLEQEKKEMLHLLQSELYARLEFEEERSCLGSSFAFQGLVERLQPKCNNYPPFLLFLAFLSFCFTSHFVVVGHRETPSDSPLAKRVPARQRAPRESYSSLFEFCSIEVYNIYCYRV